MGLLKPPGLLPQPPAPSALVEHWYYRDPQVSVVKIVLFLVTRALFFPSVLF